MTEFRLTEIDDLTRGDHYYLTDQDRCFYFGEYTARKGFGHSETNRLISNFKKPLDRKGLPDYRYKLQAIRQVASWLNRGPAGKSVGFSHFAHNYMK